MFDCFHGIKNGTIMFEGRRVSRDNQVVFAPTEWLKVNWFERCLLDHPESHLLRCLGRKWASQGDLAQQIANEYSDLQHQRAYTYLLQDHGSSNDFSCKMLQGEFFRVLPWECSLSSFKTTWSRRLENIRNENRAWGLDSNVLLENAGTRLIEKAHVEAGRLISLISSIRADGFSVRPFIEAVALLDGGTKEVLRLLVKAGTHRALALTYLGASHIPLVIRMSLDRTQLETCAGVESGLFTLDEARGIFDRLLA